MYRLPRITRLFMDIKKSVSARARIHRTPTNVSDSIIKYTRNPADLKILSQEYMKKFRDFFPSIVQDLTSNNLITNVPEVNERLAEIMNYNVYGGKQLRAAILIAVYKFIKEENQITEVDIHQAILLSWCLEMMSSYFLIFDDIIDKSETRRGKTCWFKRENVGLNAINDGVLIQMGLFKLLNKYFSTHKFYQQMVEVFLEVNLKTFVGQTLDSATSTTRNFSRERFYEISDNKTGYYTFYFPVVLAMYLAERPDLNLQQNTFEILMELGRFYQYQNDYMDCYGEDYSGKLGTDIQEGKCTWLIISALEKASSCQKKVLKENYGKWDKDSVDKIRNIYNELKLKENFDSEVENCLYRINTHLLKMRNSSSGKLMNELTKVLLGYQAYIWRN